MYTTDIRNTAKNTSMFCPERLRTLCERSWKRRLIMPSMGIIDNREFSFKQKFADFCKHTVNLNLASGYFYVSGFDLVKDSLKDIKRIRIVMGNETNIDTAKELSLGHKQKVEDELIKDLNKITDQDTEKINALGKLHEFIKEGKIEVKVYTKDKFHAKAYIFERENESIGDVAVVGSSNFTFFGMQSNTELNSIHKQDADLDQLKKWYEVVWKEAETYKDELLEIIETSGVYIRNILKDKEFISPDELLRALLFEYLYHDVSTFKEVLAEFQRIGVENAKSKINKFNGCIIADSVGLGKTFIGARLIEHYQKTGDKILLLVPASVKQNWVRELERKDPNGQKFFDITLSPSKFRIMTITELSRFDLTKKRDKEKLKDIKEKFGTILLDEAHRFRNQGYYDESKNEYSGNKNYANLKWIKSLDKKYVLLTATPLNNTIIDLKNIIEIFTTGITLKNNNLEFSDFDGYHKVLDQIKLEKEKKSSSIDKIMALEKDRSKYKDGVIKILGEIMILRTRSDINERYPDLVIEGKKVSFKMAEIKPEKYSFPKTYLSIYEHITDFLTNLNVPHIGLINEKSGVILSGLYRVLLFKRLESSVYSFVKSLERLEDKEKKFLNEIKKLGWEKVRETRKKDIAFQSDAVERDSEMMDFIEEQSSEVNNQLNSISEKEVIELVQKDLDAIKEFMDKFVPIIKLGKDEFSFDDPKLTKIKEIIGENKTNKILIFTQYVDTVKYLYNHLKGIFGLNVDCVTGDTTEGLGSNKERNKKIQLFAPISNQYEISEQEQPIDIILTTDALSEGVNLQDSNHVINYDLPWNPMRIVQRIGRVDRIGSVERTIVYNIYPDEELEALLKLLNKLQTKIKTITEVIGKENYILSPDEDINPKVIGEKIRELRETDDLRTYEEAGRNPILAHLRTIDERAQMSLELKSLIQEREYHKAQFKEHNDFVYCIMQNEHRKGVFIMFRIIDQKKPKEPLTGKLNDMILFKDLRTGEIVEKNIKDLNIHNSLKTLKKSDKGINVDLEGNLKEIEEYFRKKVLSQIKEDYTPTKMRIKEKPSKLQNFIMARLRNIVVSKRVFDSDMSNSDKEIAKKMQKLFKERAFTQRIMEKLKMVFLTDKDKKKDLQTVMVNMNKQSNSVFVRNIRKFYRKYLLEEIEYQEKLRESKDIWYRKICWGAFI